MSQTVDVVIIGAGFAGLVAARELSSRGYETAILEARDRIGGRTWTREIGAGRVELGGTWVHPWQPHVFSEMRRYGLRAEPNPNSEWMATNDDDVNRQLRVLQNCLDKFWRPYVAKVGQLHTREWASALADTDSLTVADALSRSRLASDEQQAIRSSIATNANGPVDEASLVSMLRWWVLSASSIQHLGETTGTYTVEGGTGALVRAIADDSRAELHLTTAAKALRQNDAGVEVETADGTVFKARAAICTVPIPVLNNIEFEPVLTPDISHMISTGHTGQGAKMCIWVDPSLPPTMTMAASESGFSALFTYRADNEEHLLIGFAPEPLRSTEPGLETVQAMVAQHCPDASVIDYVWHDWTTDEFSLGTWTVLPPGYSVGGPALLQKGHGRVVFAGDGTADGWNGFIDGAVESALRAANDVRRLLPPVRSRNH